ncbi:MAG: hypothetical protein R6X07_05935 [Desulfatiglandales bacterium]
MLFYGGVTKLWDMGQAWRQFPVLSDFETRLEARRWSSGEVTLDHGTRVLTVQDFNLLGSLGASSMGGTL